MYEQFLFLGASALFFVLYLFEKDEYFIIKDLWLIVGAVLMFASFFMNYTLVSSTTSTASALINGTVIATTTYTYGRPIDLSSYGYGIGILLLVIIVAFFMKSIRDAMKTWHK